MKELPRNQVELHRRSIVKAVTYRVVGTLVTCLVAWMVTGSLWTGLGISLVDSLLKIFSFYFHERLWHRVKWGLAETASPDGLGGGI